MATEQSAANGRAAVDTTEQKFTYDQWMQSVGIPVHKGFFIPDTRTMELGWWEARGLQAAFIQLMGQEGVSEARVEEIRRAPARSR